MHEGTNIKSISGIIRRSRKSSHNPPVSRRIPIAVVSTSSTSTEEKRDKKEAQRIKVIEIKSRLHYDPRTEETIETIEQFSGKGLLQQWTEIENLINQPLRRK